jgi:hypothetical protein
MADPSGFPVNRSSELISRLRSTAANHCLEIEEERHQEAVDESKRLKELEHYAKRRKREKDNNIAASTATQTMKLRSARGKRASQSMQLDTHHGP